jgi:hypothetical protein
VTSLIGLTCHTVGPSTSILTRLVILGAFGSLTTDSPIPNPHGRGHHPCEEPIPTALLPKEPGPVYEKHMKKEEKEQTAKRARSPHRIQKDLALPSSCTPRVSHNKLGGTSSPVKKKTRRGERVRWGDRLKWRGLTTVSGCLGSLARRRNTCEPAAYYAPEIPVYNAPPPSLLV